MFRYVISYLLDAATDAGSISSSWVNASGMVIAQTTKINAKITKKAYMPVLDDDFTCISGLTFPPFVATLVPISIAAFVIFFHVLLKESLPKVY